MVPNFWLRESKRRFAFAQYLTKINDEETLKFVNTGSSSLRKSMLCKKRYNKGDERRRMYCNFVFGNVFLDHFRRRGHNNLLLSNWCRLGKWVEGRPLK